MKDRSIWLDDIKRNNYPQLENNLDCDILIIGGGITGICCAYFLKESNKKIVLIEANQLGTAVTAKSTGKLTYLQEDLLDKIKNIYNKDIALKYINSQIDAINLATRIIIDNNIDCDLQNVSSYIFTNKRSNIKTINSTYNNLKDNYNITIRNKIPLKVKCIKAIEANDTYVFHPVKFVLGVAEKIKNKINIYENTRILYLENKKDYWRAKTNNNTIKAKTIIVACHYPFFILPYYFPFKTTLEKSFIVASKIDKVKSFSAINIDSDVLSFRYHKCENNYFIMLSETDDLAKNIDNIKKRDKLLSTMKKRFSSNITHCWINHDIMTFDYMPLVGKIDKNIFLATGYNTWGMTNGILAGKIISDILLKKKNQYITLFDPLRELKNIPNLINYNIKNGVSFIDTKINKKRPFYKKDVKIIKENGVWYGIYIDENNVEHKVLNKCPHMKCNLSFNYHTKSWDCPCHGSSFDIDGNVVYGPSTLSIKVNKNSK